MFMSYDDHDLKLLFHISLEKPYSSTLSNYRCIYAVFFLNINIIYFSFHYSISKKE